MLLLSRGADLMADHQGGCAQSHYGIFSNCRLSPAALAERRAALLAVWEAGPHPSQVNLRTQQRNWAHRWPLMSVLVGCGYRPLVSQRLALPEPPTPPELSPTEWRRVLVFSSDVLLRLIVSFI